MDNPHQLTKLEQFALAAMQGDMANPDGKGKIWKQEAMKMFIECAEQIYDSKPDRLKAIQE